MSTKVTAQDYIAQHKLHAVLDSLVQPIVKRRSARPLEELSQQGLFITPAAVHANSSTSVQATTQDLASLEFDAFNHYQKSGSPMLHQLALRIFESHGLLAHFGISAATFLLWVATVDANYHSENSFHNFLHAFNVCQTANVYLTALQRETGFAISKLDAFTVLVAALCHDLQHPGVTNQFLTLTNHSLSLRYNDQSVLESHHSSVALSMFFGPSASTSGGAALIASFSAADVAAFRRLLVDLILSTDLAAHGQLVEKLSAVADAAGPADRAKKLLGSDSKLLLLKAVVKASDISNEARSFQFSQRWAPLVKEEFYLQGDTQKSLGHNGINAMYDRSLPQSAVCFDQPQFIEFLCTPLYAVLERIAPVTFGIPTGNLKANALKWKQQQPGYNGPAANGSSSYASLAGSKPGSPVGSPNRMIPPPESEESEDYESEDDN